MLFPTISFGKTYKSDGSIISNSGEIIKESRSVRYQKAQKAFQNGEEITDWPTVKANKNGKSYGQKNYFGHEILEVGAPLLSLEQLRIKDGNIMEAVAKNHGFENEKILNIAIISMSNETFQIDNNISEKINLNRSSSCEISLSVVKAKTQKQINTLYVILKIYNLHFHFLVLWFHILSQSSRLAKPIDDFETQPLASAIST